MTGCKNCKSTTGEIQLVEIEGERVEELVAKMVLKENPKLKGLLLERKFISEEPVLEFKEGVFRRMANVFTDLFN